LENFIKVVRNTLKNEGSNNSTAKNILISARIIARRVKTGGGNGVVIMHQFILS